MNRVLDLLDVWFNFSFFEKLPFDTQREMVCVALRLRPSIIGENLVYVSNITDYKGCGLLTLEEFDLLLKKLETGDGKVFERVFFAFGRSRSLWLKDFLLPHLDRYARHENPEILVPFIRCIPLSMLPKINPAVGMVQWWLRHPNEAVRRAAAGKCYETREDTKFIYEAL